MGYVDKLEDYQLILLVLHIGLVPYKVGVK